MTKLLARILTRSFPGKETSLFGEAASSLESAGSNPEPRSGEYPSCAFAMWGELIGKTTGHRILELGALSSKSLNYFAGRGARLSVMSVNLEEPGNNLQAQLEGSAPEQPYDGTLCWDLLNYMSVDDFCWLGGWLAKNMRPGGVVMACLATKIPYPRSPARYVIVADDRLQYEAQDLDESGQQLRLNAADLGRHWGRFEVERSFLLRNGMQEYVLRRRKD